MPSSSGSGLRALVLEITRDGQPRQLAAIRREINSKLDAPVPDSRISRMMAELVDSGSLVKPQRGTYQQVVESKPKRQARPEAAPLPPTQERPTRPTAGHKTGSAPSTPSGAVADAKAAQECATADVSTISQQSMPVAAPAPAIPAPRQEQKPPPAVTPPQATPQSRLAAPTRVRRPEPSHNLWELRAYFAPVLWLIVTGAALLFLGEFVGLVVGASAAVLLAIYYQRVIHRKRVNRSAAKASEAAAAAAELPSQRRGSAQPRQKIDY